VFIPSADKPFPQERKMVAGVISGRRYAAQWNQSGEKVDIFDLKGILETLRAVFWIKNFKWEPSNKISYLHPGCSGDILIDALKVGCAGMLHPDVQEAFEIENEVFLFEMGIEGLVSHVDHQRKYTPYSRFPAVQRDVALVLDEELTWTEVLEKARESADPRAIKIDLFDVYSGAPIPEGKKSLAFRITYQDSARSLTDEEINGLQEGFLKELLPALHAELR